MLFNSWEFLCLLAVTFALYYLIPWLGRGRAWQVSILLVASAVFYGWENPWLLLILAFSGLGNSVAVAQIIRLKLYKPHEAKQWLRWAVILNLALLVVFKYAGFLVGSIPFVPASWVKALGSIPLPIGISFYTFHGISMVVDVWRGEVKDHLGEKSSGYPSASIGVRDIGFYLLFFPQLIAGPIVKAKYFWPQIGTKLHEDIQWKVAVKALVAGYFLKMVVADNLAEQTVILSQPAIQQLGALNLIPLLYGYSFQIFADFAGYSLIAIGLAAMFCYRFPDNFNFPYLSTSITEFWRRWHISLSSWLRDYLYIPLGGNRKGEGRTYLNLFVVMALGGIWHGAEWKFAIWGMMHGFLLSCERYQAGRKKGDAISPAAKCLGWFYTFHAVTLLWLTFLVPDVRYISYFFNGLTHLGKPQGAQMFSLMIFGAAIVLYHFAGWVKEHRPALFGRCQSSPAEGFCYGLMLFLIITNSGAPQGFIYFQF